MAEHGKTSVFDLKTYVEKHGLTVGIKIPPQSYVEVKSIKDEETGQVLFPLHILSACLGTQAGKGERAILTYCDSEADEVEEVVCASLSHFVAENVTLDLISQGDFVLGNQNADNTWIHILGRVTSEFDDEEEQQEQPRFNFFGEDDDDDDDDDDYEEEEDDEEDEDDDDLPTMPSRVKIEQIPSDDDDEEEEKPLENAAKLAKSAEPVQKRAKLNEDKEKKSSAKNLPAPKKREETSKQAMKEQKSAAKEDKKTASHKGEAEEGKHEKREESEKKEDQKMNESKDEKTPNVDRKQSQDKAHDASKTATPSGIAADKVLQFVKEELKKSKTIKSTDLGTAIATKFGTSFKKMGFEEKSLAKFLEAHAKGEVVFENEEYKLKH